MKKLIILVSALLSLQSFADCRFFWDSQIVNKFRTTLPSMLLTTAGTVTMANPTLVSGSSVVAPDAIATTGGFGFMSVGLGTAFGLSLVTLIAFDFDKYRQLIDDAEASDGASLKVMRDYILKYYRPVVGDVTIAEIADAVLKANDQDEFCKIRTEKEDGANWVSYTYDNKDGVRVTEKRDMALYQDAARIVTEILKKK